MPPGGCDGPDYLEGAEGFGKIREGWKHPDTEAGRDGRLAAGGSGPSRGRKCREQSERLFLCRPAAAIRLGGTPGWWGAKARAIQQAPRQTIKEELAADLLLSKGAGLRKVERALGGVRRLLRLSKLNLNGQEKWRRGDHGGGLGRRKKQGGCGVLRKSSRQTWSGRDGA